MPTLAKAIPRLSEKDQLRFWSNVQSRNDQSLCWNWSSRKDDRGYGRFIINKIDFQAHRVSFAISNDWPPFEAFGVCHRCDNTSCINPAHLFTGTQKDNIGDCASKGRQNKGEAQWKAKLTVEQVREIKRLHAQGAKCSDLSRMFNTCRDNIRWIASGRGWKHVSV